MVIRSKKNCSRDGDHEEEKLQIKVVLKNESELEKQRW
jgi:hypothetical protein